MGHRIGAIFKNPRAMRLDRDLAEIQAMKDESTILDFETKGNPPEEYLVTFHGKSLIPKNGEHFPATQGTTKDIGVGNKQQVSIRLTGEYPRRAPEVKWMTPILHPNIWGRGTVCLGNFGSNWTPYIKLADLIEVLWDMERLAILNPHSAGTGASNAMKFWKDLDDHFHFPIDKRPLRDKVLTKEDGSSIVRDMPRGADDVVLLDDDESCPLK